jgi:hypothetical protein
LRGRENERRDLFNAINMPFCCFGTIVQVFQASVLQQLPGDAAPAAALIRRECAGRKVRAIPLNLLTLAFFIWLDIHNTPDVSCSSTSKPVPTPAANGRRVKLYEPDANDLNNIKKISYECQR